MIMAGANGYAQERKNILGARLDVVAGGTIDPNITGSQRGSFYNEIYPAIDLNSSSQNSVLQFSYAFGLRRTRGAYSNLGNNDSHVASAAFSRTLGPNWKLTVSDSYQLTSDYNSFNAARGTIGSSQGFRFLFDAIARDQSSQSNTAAITADYLLSEKSTLSLSGSHSFRNYADDTAFSGILSDQHRVSESITFTQTVTARDGWSVGYTGTYLAFSDFEDSRFHALTAGYSRQLRPSLSVRLAGGPSFIQATQSANGYTGYNAAASLQKVVEPRHKITLYYTYSSGDSSGLGSVSDNRSAGLGITSLLGDTTTLVLDLSAFETRGRMGNPYNTRGVSAAASLGVPLSRRLSLNWGAQYQRHDQTRLFGFEQKRVFVSLRFNAPELWKGLQ